MDDVLELEKRTEQVDTQTASNGELADELGRTNELRKQLEKEEKRLKDELKSRQTSFARGRFYVIHVVPKSRSVFDKEALKGTHGQEFVDKYTKLSEYLQVDISKR